MAVRMFLASSPDNFAGVPFDGLLKRRWDVDSDRVAFEEAVRNEKEPVTRFEVNPMCAVLDVDESECRVRRKVDCRMTLAQ